MKIIPSLALLASAFCASTSFAANLIDLTQNDFRQPKSAAYELKTLKEIRDRAGNTHIRYEQTYQGIPVYGYHVIEHHYAPSLQANRFDLMPFSGTFVNGIEQDLALARGMQVSDPKTTLADLKIAYADKHQLPLGQLQFENEFARTVIFINENEQAQLAHEVNFFVDLPEGGMPSRPYYLVDAETGKIIKQWEGLTHERIGEGPGGNLRIGEYYYGKTYPKLDITKGTARCNFTGEGGKTVNMNNRRKDSTTAYSYNCRNSVVQNKDATNGAASPLNDAHYFIDVLTQFYNDRYNTAPLPFPLVMRAHYGRSYANAFWNGSSMTYGDGNEELYPFVVLDIAAHEIAHGVTQNNSDLVYQYQSGGLNEAFSDMASRAVEYYVHGTNDWYLGGGIFKDPSILALRYMDDPTRDGRSIDHASDYNDGLDVHLTSGVFNKAFTLLATAPGWNTATAFDMMYFANVAHWQPNTTFAQAAWGVVRATQENGRNVTDVINAFEQVGISCDTVAKKCT